MDERPLGGYEQEYTCLGISAGEVLAEMHRRHAQDPVFTARQEGGRWVRARGGRWFAVSGDQEVAGEMPTQVIELRSAESVLGSALQLCRDARPWLAELTARASARQGGQAAVLVGGFPGRFAGTHYSLGIPAVGQEAFLHHVASAFLASWPTAACPVGGWSEAGFVPAPRAAACTVFRGGLTEIRQRPLIYDRPSYAHHGPTHRLHFSFEGMVAPGALQLTEAVLAALARAFQRAPEALSVVLLDPLGALRRWNVWEARAEASAAVHGFELQMTAVDVQQCLLDQCGPVVGDEAPYHLALPRWQAALDATRWPAQALAPAAARDDDWRLRRYLVEECLDQAGTRPDGPECRVIHALAVAGLNLEAFFAGPPRRWPTGCERAAGAGLPSPSRFAEAYWERGLGDLWRAEIDYRVLSCRGRPSLCDELLRCIDEPDPLQGWEEPAPRAVARDRLLDEHRHEPVTAGWTDVRVGGRTVRLSSPWSSQVEAADSGAADSAPTAAALARAAEGPRKKEWPRAELSLLERAIARFTTDCSLEQRTQILGRAAELCRELGRFDQEVACRRGILALVTTDRGGALNQLGMTLDAAGHHAAALVVTRRARAYYPANAAQQRDLMNNVANELMALHEGGRSEPDGLQRAKLLLDEVVTIEERLLGDSDLGLATARNNLAHVHRLLGQFEESLVLSERAWAVREARLGALHPLSIQALCNLAMIHLDAGRPVEARHWLQSAVRRGFQVHDPGSAALAETMARYGEALRRCPDDGGRAVAYLAAGVRGLRRALGTADQRTQSAMQWLALARGARSADRVLRDG